MRRVFVEFQPNKKFQSCFFPLFSESSWFYFLFFLLKFLLIFQKIILFVKLIILFFFIFSKTLLFNFIKEVIIFQPRNN